MSRFSKRHFVMLVIWLVFSGPAMSACNFKRAFHSHWVVNLMRHDDPWVCNIFFDRGSFGSGKCFVPDPTHPRIEITPGSSHPRPYYPDGPLINELTLQYSDCEFDMTLKLGNGISQVLRGILSPNRMIAAGFYTSVADEAHPQVSGSFLMMKE